MPDERLIEAWSDFRAALSARAPVSFAHVEAASSDQGLLVRELDLAQPEVVQTWFSLHDGAGFDFDGGMILPGNFALSQQRALADTMMTREIWADTEAGQTASTSGDLRTAGSVVGTWLPEYVMISTDTTGGGYFLDLRPGPLHGCVRNWDKVNSDEAELVAPTFSGWIASLAQSVVSGDNVAYWKPALTNGRLEWEIDPTFL